MFGRRGMSAMQTNPWAKWQFPPIVCANETEQPTGTAFSAGDNTHTSEFRRGNTESRICQISRRWLCFVLTTIWIPAINKPTRVTIGMLAIACVKQGRYVERQHALYIISPTSMWGWSLYEKPYRNQHQISEVHIFVVIVFSLRWMRWRQNTKISVELLNP